MKRFILSAALCAIAACGDEPPAPKVEPEPIRSAEPIAPAPEAEPTPDEVPIPEDFEEEAAKNITASDLRAHLDALEQEISTDTL